MHVATLFMAMRQYQIPLGNKNEQPLHTHTPKHIHAYTIEGLSSKGRIVVYANASPKVVYITRESVARKRKEPVLRNSAAARCYARWLAIPISGQLQGISGCIASPVPKCATLTSPCCKLAGEFFTAKPIHPILQLCHITR